MPLENAFSVGGFVKLLFFLLLTCISIDGALLLRDPESLDIFRSNGGGIGGGVGRLPDERLGEATAFADCWFRYSNKDGTSASAD